MDPIGHKEIYRSSKNYVRYESYVVKFYTRILNGAVF